MPKIPNGFTTVFPYLVVIDAHDYVEFLCKGLGGQLLSKHNRPDGTLANAQVRFGDTTLMVGEAREDWPANRGHYYFYVDDADAAVKQAVDHGAELIMPVADQPYGDRQGGVKDACGNIWWISQHLADGYF